ncbi:MAG: hypothetical protein COS37_09120 [Anaerolineae bacterium CG03_land_8_20_14_0_80_58_20]|nr:MAG: hypothetical protein COS37_09120 [Anaerolineae bacterium CG03_land_8_20_14_0_80_58_20]
MTREELTAARQPSTRATAKGPERGGYNYVMPDKKSPPLPDEFLSSEFEYIANSAFQANEDRSKAASFFIVSVGSLAAAIFGAQQLGEMEVIPRTLYLLLFGLFLTLTALGALTVAQLARLRSAWHEAALAMNQMKDFYAARFDGLEAAFLWRTETLPPKYKTGSISYYTALEVALLSALTFGASVYFLQVGIPYTRCLWAFTISAGALAFFAQLFLYKRLLTEKRKP